MEYRQNFIHLYMDIGWFGVLSGSAVNFLSIYATRLGATGYQIGLLSSMAAAVSLILAIPAGRRLEITKHQFGCFPRLRLVPVGIPALGTAALVVRRAGPGLGVDLHRLIDGHPAHAALGRIQRPVCICRSARMARARGRNAKHPALSYLHGLFPG